jgi:L-ascorbate metabolism protein UlaG (beta-lactamase superfamily)
MATARPSTKIRSTARREPKRLASRLLWQLARSYILPSAPAHRNGGLLAPNSGAIAITYVGHATTLVQLGAVNLLTDPVYSTRLILPKRLVEPGIPIGELPRLDLVLVSHGHMDHLDVPTHYRLPKSAIAVCASHLSDLLRPCGYREIIELRWGDTFSHLGVTITAVPVKHWGTRGLLPDNRGYCGFVIESPDGTVFFPGDTAYFPGFREYGLRYRIDAALLPIGAYNPPSFRRVHMNPEDALQAFVDLRARYLVPVHWGTFVVSLEPIEEPTRWLRALADANGIADRVAILRHGESRVFPSVNGRRSLGVAEPVSSATSRP